MKEAREIEELRAFQAAHKGGDRTPREIATSQVVKKIMLPLCPDCKAQSLSQYMDELASAGFAIRQAERGGSLHTNYAAIIVAAA